MLSGRDEIDKTNWLMKELMFCKLILLKELTLPFGEPGCELIVLIVVQER